jgi:hypothetical protein
LLLKLEEFRQETLRLVRQYLLLPCFTPYVPALTMPVDEMVTIVVAPYLINKFAPDCSIEKFVVTNDVAEPVTLIGHVPVAVVPAFGGTSKFVLATDAVEAFVPPLEIGTTEFNCVGGTPPELSKLLEKLAKFIAWVIFGLSAFLFQILVFQAVFAYRQITLSY